MPVKRKVTEPGIACPGEPRERGERGSAEQYGKIVRGHVKGSKRREIVQKGRVGMMT